MGIFVSKKGAKFIGGWESFLSCPYFDSLGGVWTRGYGETEGITSSSPCISEKRAFRRMRWRATKLYLVHVPRRLRMKQCEKDAMASFLWNLGAGAVGRDTGIGRRLRSKEGKTRKGRRRIFREEMPKWNIAGGVPQEGLTKRRKAEVKVANRNIYDSSH